MINDVGVAVRRSDGRGICRQATRLSDDMQGTPQTMQNQPTYDDVVTMCISG